MRRHRRPAVPIWRFATAGLLGAALVARAGFGGDFTPPERPVRIVVDPGNDTTSAWYPMLSADGRMVAFLSRAQSARHEYACVHDLATGVTRRLVAPMGADNGTWSSAMSPGGRFVAFASNTTRDEPGGEAANAIFLHDHETGQSDLVSMATPSEVSSGFCWVRAVSEDGRFVTFVSDAADLVDGDTNKQWDIFVHDRETATTSRVSVSSSGSESNGKSNWHDISGDGTLVVFWSDATNLVEGDTNGATDIFVHDRRTGRTTRVSVSSAGGQANGQSLNPAISLDGRFVVFESEASNLAPQDTDTDDDVFVHDIETGRTEVASYSLGPGLCTSYPSVSGDGRYVAFSTEDAVYVHDRRNRLTRVVGRAGQMLWSHVSADGRTIAFDSFASHMVQGRENWRSDVFVVANPLFEKIDGTNRDKGSRATGSGAGADGEAPNEF